jgi:signal transduction histidine kinase
MNIRENQNHIEVTVEDNGIGFDPNEIYPKEGKLNGYGLYSIQERLTGLGGSLKVHASQGKGSRVTLTVPTRRQQSGKKSE